MEITKKRVLKTILTVTILSAFVATLYASGAWSQMYTAARATGFISELYAPSRPDFKGYTTASKLGPARLLDADLIRYKEEGLDVWHFDYVLRYSFGVTVYERKAEYPNSTATCRTEPNSVRGDYVHTCKESSIKSGDRYIVATSTYKGELYSVTAKALIGKTSIYVAIPEERLQEFADYDDWGAYFDSLSPVDLSDVPFAKKTPRHIEV